MEAKEVFATWLRSARKADGNYYTENTQISYVTAICKVQEALPYFRNLTSVSFDSINAITTSDYYSSLAKSRQRDLVSALKLYQEFLQDRENGWQTIAEFSEGKQFAATNEFSLHVTYDEAFSVKELSEFLQEIDAAFKDMLIEQGYSQTQACHSDMTIVRVSEGSLWFEIASTVIPIAMPILMFVLDRIFKKRDEKKCVCKVDEKEAKVHKNSKRHM